jgi:hypothetical protein
MGNPIGLSTAKYKGERGQNQMKIAKYVRILAKLLMPFAQVVFYNVFTERQLCKNNLNL